MAKSSQTNTAVLVTLLAIGAGWATWLLYWPLGLMAYVPLLVWASRKGRKPAIACTATTPFLIVPLIWFALGVHAYLEGSAVLMVRGVPTIESTNLEARHRVPLMHPPHTTDTRNVFGWLSYEGGVRLFGRIAGPMKGAYTGPYPGRAQAWRYLDAAPDAFVEGDIIQVGTRYAALPNIDLHHPAPVRAHRIGQTLVIGHPDQLWLIEERTGSVFATWRRSLTAPPRFKWPNGAALLPAPTVADVAPRPYASPAY